jgi:hypothetical protein
MTYIEHADARFVKTVHGDLSRGEYLIFKLSVSFW